MNKNIVIVGGLIIVALIAAFAYSTNKNSITASDPNATSTVAATDTNPAGSVTPGETRTAGAPVVTTNATVAPTDTTAVVTGTVIPKGALTSYWYEYGTTANLGNKTANQSVGSGYVAIPTPGYITGLSKNTTYYYRLVAENSFGRVSGAQNTLRTTEGTPAPVGGVPSSRTLAASGISRTSANLRGEVSPNKAATQYWFEYGTNENLGNTTAFVSVGDGNATVSATAPVTNLEPGTTYYYRVNAQNQFGTVNGAILTFRTSGPAAAAPSATTRSATNIGATTATLRGTVDPNGAETTYWFEYSSDSLLGSLLLKTTASKSAGAGTNSVSVETDVSGLSSNTTYYVRIVAQNTRGTVRGDKESFRTE